MAKRDRHAAKTQAKQAASATKSKGKGKGGKGAGKGGKGGRGGKGKDGKSLKTGKVTEDVVGLEPQLKKAAVTNAPLTRSASQGSVAKPVYVDREADDDDVAFFEDAGGAPLLHQLSRENALCLHDRPSQMPSSPLAPA